MPQAVFLNSGISGYEYLDKIVQLPFCLPNIEERKKRAYLSKMVEAKELDPKRVLSRVQKELQEASLYVPFKKLPEPTRSSDDGGNLRSENQMRALVNAARGMRKANLLVNDPMRRAEMGISEDGLIEQIETDGNGARDDRKESFLFMLSEEAKVQKSKRLTQAQSERPAEPDNQPSAERGATAAVVEKGNGSASSPGGEGGAVSEAAAENERPEQEPRFLLTDAGSIGRSNDQEARCVLQWNGVVQAGLWGGVESRAESLSVGRVGDQLPGDGKWRGGVLAADGNIYGIPSNATQVLRFDPRTQQATLVGDELPGGGKSFLWTLVQRTLLAQALVETLDKLQEQANALTLPSEHERAREKAVLGAFEKAVGQLRNPEVRGSFIVDEEDKLRFEKQLNQMHAAVKKHDQYADSCCRDGVGRLGQLMINVMHSLVHVTARCGKPIKASKWSTAGFGFYSTLAAEEPTRRMPHHETDSLMGQLEKRLKQSREAKVAEWHAAAIVFLLALLLLPPLVLLLLLLLLLPQRLALLSPLILLLPIAVLFAAACRHRKANLAIAVAGDGDANEATEPNSNNNDGAAASQVEHSKRVIELLIGGPVGVGGEWTWRTIGLGEVGQSTISLATTLRYAVLRSAQLLAFCCASAYSLCASLATCLTCTTEEDDTLPEGGTKYIVVDFNAWVYSGVRTASRTHT